MCLKILLLEDDIRVGSQYLEVEEVHMRVRRMQHQNVHVASNDIGVLVNLVLVINVVALIIIEQHVQ